METIIVFDTETTGLIKPKIRRLSDQPFIIEYCFKKYHFSKNYNADPCRSIFCDIGSISGFLKPPMPLPKVITKITGITDKDLENSPKFIDKVDEITDFFLGVDVLVAHNLPFDRSMLANELLRLDKVLNFPWPPRHICTVQETLKIKGYRLSLTKLHNHLFGDDFNAHRADEDVEALSRCFIELCKQGIISL